MTGRGCNIRGCDRPHDAHGLCARHYRRWRRGQIPERRPAPHTRRTRITYTRGGKAV